MKNAADINSNNEDLEMGVSCDLQGFPECQFLRVEVQYPFCTGWHVQLRYSRHFSPICADSIKFLATIILSLMLDYHKLPGV